MKVPLLAVARPGVAEGIGLAGVKLVDTVPAGKPAVVLVDEKLCRCLPRRRDIYPIVLSLPDPATTLGRAHAEDEVLELLRRAVGYRVRLT